jgi:DNA-binding transcriptional LysR family regulator
MVANRETISGALEDVRAFCAVFELGSISAAARQLDTTKGGLSRRVSRLERRLGVKLLARTPRAVSPTEEGVAFYAKAHDALTLLDEALDGARQSQSIPQGHLRVTAPPDFGVDVLPPLIVQFQAQHPQITVELVVSNALLDLAALRIDLALRASTHDLPDMNYRASAIIEFPIALYAAPTYLAVRQEPSRPADLTDHSIIAVSGSAGAERLTLTDQRGRSESLTLRPVIRSGDFASALRLIEAGGGIGGLPDIVAASGARGGTLVRVLPDWILARAKLHAISLAGHEAPARVRAFREFIREQLAAACPQ